MKPQIPIVSLEAADKASQLERACREFGFFYLVDHGVDEQLQQSLEAAATEFFAQDLSKKLEIEMAHGGKAWRGYFPVEGELTSGKPDLKEGIYFGAELDGNDPMVKSGTPLHGPNLFPTSMPHLRRLVLDYMAALTALGHRLMAGISLSLGLPESYFADRYTSDPLILFRLFNYPSRVAGFGVGEHTDYGLMTIVRQDLTGGLQIRFKSTWLAVPPIPNAFVCNVGDMLDRITGGAYLSAPHRVRNVANRNRLSFAFFFDPNFNAEVSPIDFVRPARDNKNDRWDHASVHEFRGTYGDYLLSKVSKVFPELYKVQPWR